MNTQDVSSLSSLKEQLRLYHGATKLKNIPELVSSELFQTLLSRVPVSLEQTVADITKRIDDVLSAESVISQFQRFQQESAHKHIILSQRLPENQRNEFYQGKNTHEWMQMLFSPHQYYFTINPTSFKKGDKQHNRGVFERAIDTVIIDPAAVNDSSLEALGIALDLDCQQLKDVFKHMRPLHYQDSDRQSYSIRIHEYHGQYIVFAAYKTAYVPSGPATQGEQKKEDIIGHMSVYPDIFSMIRREEHILDTAQEKHQQYLSIKAKLSDALHEIDRNKKEYGIRVQQNIHEIISEIDNATSAKVVADKLYHLSKITGRHSQNDMKLLEASMRNFTQRIAQLLGIAFHTQLHLLELSDALEDQALDIQSFHAHVRLALHKPTIQQQNDMLVLACETYDIALQRSKSLKEPFLTFARQIRSLCGQKLSDTKDRMPMIRSKILSLVTLQEQTLAGYMLQHDLSLGNMSIEEVTHELDRIKPGFRSDMTKMERDAFFDTLKNLAALQQQVDELLTHG